MDSRTIYAYESAAAGALARPCGHSTRMSSAWQATTRTRSNAKRGFVTVPARRPMEPTD